MRVTPDILDKIIRELEARGLFIDDYEEVFGCKSFDEILEVVNSSTVSPGDSILRLNFRFLRLRFQLRWS